MSRDDPDPRAGAKLFCDLTQSWSEVGGGVRTYLLHKRRHILEQTPHRHLMIIPGTRDEVVEDDRAITVTIASPHVPGSPHYRLMLRNRAVRETLEHFRPDLIECQDAYNLPWAAIGHRKRHPETALVAAYMTDFPTVYVERPFAKFVGRHVANLCGKLCYSYCGALYGRFDEVFALSENGGAAKLRICCPLCTSQSAVLSPAVMTARPSGENATPQTYTPAGSCMGGVSPASAVTYAPPSPAAAMSVPSGEKLTSRA